MKQKFVCEPLLKAYCTTYGRRVTAGTFVPYVVGVGELHLGDGVNLAGKLTLCFGTQYCDRPTITVGENTHLGHDLMLTAGKQITIGRDCLFASSVLVMDSSGHPLDAAQRRAGKAAPPEKVRPVVIEDDVWVGSNCILLPGTRIGEGSVISAGSVVRGTIPPYSLVAGNPAQVVAQIPRSEPASES